MKIFYEIGIRLFYIAAVLSSLFSIKSKQWIKGRKGWYKSMTGKINPGDQILWFHAASLGEFEQGRPVIEKIRNLYPEFKILLTFFSPSGYEIRKGYTGADYIFYLPLDSRSNAKKFVNLVNPKMAFFIKYEYWYNFLLMLNKKDIPVYLISGIFRNNQVFFKFYGSWYKKTLDFFTYFFVQNRQSQELLIRNGIRNTGIAGDTRFDRVLQVASAAKKIEKAEIFKNDKTVLVAGSTWPRDEEYLIKYINRSASDQKFIIAPHEIDNSHIERIESACTKKTIRYSSADEKSLVESDVLIIDNIGMLSSLYRYGELAYIGGGFGAGIHNILEAATFKIPVLFGPNHKKFNEAVELIKAGGAFTIHDYDDLERQADRLLANGEQLKSTGAIAGDFVERHAGATQFIIKHVFGK